MSTNRLLARGFAVAVAAGTLVLAGGAVASAHVTANVTEPAKKGGYSKITFRVPNEDNTQGTIKLQLVFPKDTPLTSARPKPVPGWTAEVTKVTLDKPVKGSHGAEVKEAIGTITWTAQPGTRINPGEFQEFDVSAGPLPDADQLVIPAIQTYDGAKGEVKWDAPPTPGAEPEHPAPVVKLVAAAAGEDAHGSTGTEAAVKPASDSQAAAAGTDNTARWLGGIGLLVGALGLGLGVGATLRAKRTKA
jgi:periplasmic copper chaperone A